MKLQLVTAVIRAQDACRPDPMLPPRTILEFPGNTTRSCSWTASERTCGRSVSGVHDGEGSRKLVVFQTPPSVAATTYITLGLLGSGGTLPRRCGPKKE